MLNLNKLPISLFFLGHKSSAIPLNKEQPHISQKYSWEMKISTSFNWTTIQHKGYKIIYLYKKSVWRRKTLQRNKLEVAQTTEATQLLSAAEMYLRRNFLISEMCMVSLMAVSRLRTWRRPLFSVFSLVTMVKSTPISSYLKRKGPIGAAHRWERRCEEAV